MGKLDLRGGVWWEENQFENLKILRFGKKGCGWLPGCIECFGSPLCQGR